MESLGEAETKALDAVCELLNASTLLPPGVNLKADTRLLDGGLLDSLGILQLTERIEETFGIKVADEDFVPENFETVRSLARYISRRLAAV